MTSARGSDREVFGPERNRRNTNALELHAVISAVKSFAKNKKGIQILIRTDSSTAMASINHLGGTHSSVLNKLAFGLWTWAMERNIFLRAEHLPGLRNTIADEESRSVRDRCTWMIHRRVFAHLQQVIGP